MIMERGQPLLLPASPVFIGASLAAAFLLDLLQTMGSWGRAAWLPDLVALVFAFWCVHQPQRVGMGAGFALGLLIDVHQGSALGLHALAYTVLGFFAAALHRRLLWFNLAGQALQVLPLFALAHLIVLALRLAGGGSAPGWWLLLAPLLEALLWPPTVLLLLAPQRRTPHPDENRPL